MPHQPIEPAPLSFWEHLWNIATFGRVAARRELALQQKRLRNQRERMESRMYAQRQRRAAFPGSASTPPTPSSQAGDSPDVLLGPSGVLFWDHATRSSQAQANAACSGVKASQAAGACESSVGGSRSDHGSSHSSDSSSSDSSSSSSSDGGGGGGGD
jgi:uncharacterized membrane protein YgcG